jgi:hypothetical protein
MRVIAGLPAGNFNELQGGTELFPQLPRARRPAPSPARPSL